MSSSILLSLLAVLTTSSVPSLQSFSAWPSTACTSWVTSTTVAQEHISFSIPWHNTTHGTSPGATTTSSGWELLQETMHASAMSSVSLCAMPTCEHWKTAMASACYHWQHGRWRNMKTTLARASSPEPVEVPTSLTRRHAASWLRCTRL